MMDLTQIQGLVDTTTLDLIDKHQDLMYTKIMDRLEDRLSEIDEMRSDLKTQTKKMLATKQEMSANADRLRIMERTNTGAI